MKRLCTLFAVVLSALMLAACSTNPATGKSQFNTLSESKEIELGGQAEPQFLQEYGGDVPSPAIAQYVNELGRQLAAVSERPKLPWEFHVVDSSVLNAFSLPGGKVFVSRGLMVKLQNKAQLAGVLGHEIGHVTAQHIGQQMTRADAVQKAQQALGVAGQVAGGDNSTLLQALGLGAEAGGTLYMLKFGRDQESQADELGMRYMSRLGYNPQAQRQVMQILKEAAGAGSMEMLQTHPLPQTRIDRIDAILKSDYPRALQPNNSYTFDPDSYRSIVLNNLAKLPPPKSNK